MRLIVFWVGIFWFQLGWCQQLGEKIFSLRQENEALYQRVEQQKRLIAQQTESLSLQKAHLSQEVAGEKLRLKQLEVKLSEAQNIRTTTKSYSEEVLSQHGNDFLTQTMAWVHSSLPFSREDRLRELEKLKDQMEERSVSPEDAISRLWSFIDDELRLSQESGLSKQIIQVDGQEYLVDVARLGMVALYFSTEDGRTGRAQWKDSSWSFQWDPESKIEISRLIDSLRKQVRSGEYSLPVSGLSKGVSQ